MREGTLADNGDHIAALYGGLGELALHCGSNRNKSFSVSGDDVVCCLDLIGLVVIGDLEFCDRGISEGEYADIVNVGTDGYLCERITLVEHTLGENCGVNVELGEGFATGKCICCILYLICADGDL